MKIRNGFVSNSSSSSFVVAFDKIPRTRKQLRNMMFPDNDQSAVKFYNYSESIDEIVNVVFKDIKRQPDIQESNEYLGYDIEQEVEDFKKIHQPEGKTCLQFNYADEDGGFFTVMEHGGIFDNMPHIQISHH